MRSRLRVVRRRVASYVEVVTSPCPKGEEAEKSRHPVVVVPKGEEAEKSRHPVAVVRP